MSARDKYLSCEIILKVTQGDPEAMTVVLEHFMPLILSLSKQGSHINEDIKSRLEMKLITKVLDFKCE